MAEAFLYVSGSATQSFGLDLASGTLTLASKLLRPWDWAAFDSTAKILYAGTGNKLEASTIERNTGIFTKINGTLIPGVANTTYLSVHPSGKWVLTAHYVEGNAFVFPVQAGGGVGASVEMVAVGYGAHNVISDPTGKFVFVACPVMDNGFVAQYRFDEATGKLTPNNPAKVVAPHPRHLAFHPSGKYAYAMGEHDSMMISFLYDGATGTLKDPEAISAVPAGFPDSAGANVVVHASGKFVYGSNRGHDSIAIFAVNQQTGRLTFVAHETAGGMLKTPSEFVQDPAGKFLFVPSQATKPVVYVFDINPQDGTLTMKAAVPTLPGPGYAGLFAPPQAVGK